MELPDILDHLRQRGNQALGPDFGIFSVVGGCRFWRLRRVARVMIVPTSTRSYLWHKESRLSRSAQRINSSIPSECQQICI
jgi:hypothetical protein